MCMCHRQNDKTLLLLTVPLFVDSDNGTCQFSTRNIQFKVGKKAQCAQQSCFGMRNFRSPEIGSARRRDEVDRLTIG